MATLTPDGGGGFILTWTDVATVWAAIEPLKGAERLHAQQLQSPVTHRVTMRYRAGVRPSMRLVFDARTLNIRAVIDPQERNRTLELLCEEGVGT